MKVKDGFWVREVGGAYIAVPLNGEARALSCIVHLNEPGALLFHRLQEGAERGDMAQALLDAYEATRDEAARAVDQFIAQLSEARLLEE